MTAQMNVGGNRVSRDQTGSKLLAKSPKCQYRDPENEDNLQRLGQNFGHWVKNMASPIENLQIVEKRYLEKASPASEPVYGMCQPCWRWTGAHDDKGRPRFKFQGKSANANRAQLMLAGQKIRPRDFVVTICREKDCVNPAHHVLGTAQDVRIVRGDQFHPYWQSIFRKAYMAGELEVEILTDGYKISCQVAHAILDEGTVPPSAFGSSSSC